MAMRIGVKLPHTGPGAPAPTIPGNARRFEDAGFDSLWVSDHIVLPSVIRSFYPFAADGVATWSSDTPYVEALVALTAAAAATQTIGLGTAALVLPQRNPILLAKQAASIDALAGGRLMLGVGAGWLREEFDALAAPFEGRGARMLEWMTLLRDCWSGRPSAHTGAYDLPADTLVLPTPARPIPLYVGGHSKLALARAGRAGDGWLAQQSLPQLDPTALQDEIATVRGSAVAAGRDPAALTIVVRIVESLGRTDEVARQLRALDRIGVDEIIVDVNVDDASPAHDVLRDASVSR